MVTRRKIGWGIAIAASLMANVAFASHYSNQANEFLLKMRELREVQIPFDNPVAMPLRYGVN